MDGSAELYADLLGQIEELLPSVADEIRRDVDRGGRELELYEPTEAYTFSDDYQEVDRREATHRRRPPRQSPSRAEQQPAQPDHIVQFRQQQRLGGNSGDIVRPLSGDGRLAILLDAVITLLRTVNGSEGELTSYLRQKGVRSVTFGVGDIDMDRSQISVDQIGYIAAQRGEVMDTLLTALAALEDLQ
ncbi:hypothetical protein ACW9HJ_27030 [Nocardia gipuzkoensis]